MTIAEEAVDAMRAAAREIERLREINAVLHEALSRLIGALPTDTLHEEEMQTPLFRARYALDKAEGRS